MFIFNSGHDSSVQCVVNDIGKRYDDDDNVGPTIKNLMEKKKKKKKRNYYYY